MVKVAVDIGSGDSGDEEGGGIAGWEEGINQSRRTEWEIR